jgi:hypothetical protein
VWLESTDSGVDKPLTPGFGESCRFFPAQIETTYLSLKRYDINGTLEEMRLTAARHLACEIDQKLSFDGMPIRFTGNKTGELKVYLLSPDNRRHSSLGVGSIVEAVSRR